MKRKRIEQSLSLGASIGMLLLLVWGCGQEPADILPASGDLSVPVNISTSIDADILHTRSTVSKGSIGVFLLADVPKIYTPQYNVEYSNSGGGARWKASKPVYVGTVNASLCAYYPYGKVPFTPNTTKCTLTAQKNDPANEVFYATSSSTLVNSNTPNATFNMVRAYAGLKLSITRHNNYRYGCYIGEVMIKSGDNFDTTCTLDICSGKLADGNKASGYRSDLFSWIDRDEINKMYDMLVPPQDLKAGLTISLTIDSAIRSVTISGGSFSGKLVSGKQYTISLLITDTQLIPNGKVTMEDYNIDDTDFKTDKPIIIDPSGPTIIKP